MPAAGPVLDLSQALKVAVQGPLLAAAVVRQRTSGEVVIDLVVGQQVEHHPEARPLHASLPVHAATFASAFAKAQAKAAQLPAGTVVVVVGHGLEAGSRHGLPVFRFLHTAKVSRLADITQQEPTNAH